MGGGGKTGIDALARASGHSPPHGGVYSGLGNERAKPLAFQIRDRQAIQPTTAPLQRREAAGRTARVQVRQRASGNERGKSASGSGQETPHPQERAARDRVRPHNFPLRFPAPDRHPNGPGLQAWSALADRAGCPEGSQIDQLSIKLFARTRIVVPSDSNKR